MSADKTKSIKEASDKELDDLLVRLRKESELQSLIAELKRRGQPFESMTSYSAPNVSTEEPINSLYHFGVLGMRWGTRRGPSSEDHTTAMALKQRGARNLSTAELKTLTSRLQLEKSLKDLDPGQIDRGLAAVKKITAAGTAVVGLYALTQTPLGKKVVNHIRSAIKKALHKAG